MPQIAGLLDNSATNDLLKFIDFASDSVKSVLIGPSRYKRTINRKKYLRRQVNRYREQLRKRETKFNGSVPASTAFLRPLFDFSSRMKTSNKPFQNNNLPALFSSKPQRNSLQLDYCFKETGENSIHSLSSTENAITRTENTSRISSCLYENNSSNSNIKDWFYDESFVPSVSMESLVRLQEWDYIDSITSTCHANIQLMQNHSTLL